MVTNQRCTRSPVFGILLSELYRMTTFLSKSACTVLAVFSGISIVFGQTPPAEPETEPGTVQVSNEDLPPPSADARLDKARQILVDAQQKDGLSEKTFREILRALKTNTGSKLSDLLDMLDELAAGSVKQFELWWKKARTQFIDTGETAPVATTKVPEPVARGGKPPAEETAKPRDEEANSALQFLTNARRDHPNLVTLSMVDEVETMLKTASAEFKQELIEQLELLAEKKPALVKNFILWWKNQPKPVVAPTPADPLATRSANSSGKNYLISGQFTAFDLIQTGNGHIPEASKNQIVQIRSEHMERSVLPQKWHIVYYDSTAPLKAIQATITEGQVKVTKPGRLLEMFGSNKPIDPNSLKVDSDRAMQIAAESIVGEAEITSSQLMLQNHKGKPIWKIKLWGPRVEEIKEEDEIGEITISAEDGTVIRNDLKAERLR